MWLVELAGLGEPELVPRAVGAALGIEAQPTQRWIDSICGFLADRDVLLILDNCEHLLDATALLVEEVLARCAGVKVLATSREALNVGGENAWSLGSLSLPPDQVSGLAALVESDAAALFVERAQSARSGFTPSEEDVHAIAEICRRLDGMPLAIELAAARVRALPVTEVGARIGDRFRFLIGGSRTALARQRTLEATVAWSYQLLEPAEQHLFDRLSVFAGSFSLDAAEVVSVGIDIDVLTGVASLVEKSLLELRDATGHARYRMLETLRMFGRDRLLDRDDAAQARNQLVQWATQFVAESSSQEWGPGERVWLDVIEDEIDNLRAAIQWTIDNQDLAGLAIAGPLRIYWWNKSLPEGLAWLEQLLELPATVTAPDLEAIGRLAYGHGLQFQGHDAEALANLRQAAVYFKDAGDTNQAAWAAQVSARCHWGLDDLGQAHTALHESIAGHRQAGDLMGELQARWLALSLELHLGHLDQARSMLPDTEALATRADSPRLAAHLDEGAFMLEALAGQTDRGRDRLHRAVVGFRDAGVHHCIAHGFQAVAFLAIRLDDPTSATQLHGAAQAILDDLGIVAPPWERIFLEPVLDACKNAFGEPELNRLLTQGAQLGLDAATELALHVASPN